MAKLDPADLPAHLRGAWNAGETPCVTIVTGTADQEEVESLKMELEILATLMGGTVMVKVIPGMAPSDH